MEVNNISNIIRMKPGLTKTLSENSLENTVSFSTFLKDSIENVNILEKKEKEYDLKIATGELENIHEAMIASKKADIALQLTMQIRNKVLDAYKEIMRMQI